MMPVPVVGAVMTNVVKTPIVEIGALCSYESAKYGTVLGRIWSLYEKPDKEELFATVLPIDFTFTAEMKKLAEEQTGKSRLYYNLKLHVVQVANLTLLPCDTLEQQEAKKK